MKKFDYFLILLAATLIYLGYSFSLRFTNNADDVSEKHKNTYVKKVSQNFDRVPSQNKKSDVVEKLKNNDLEKDYINKYVGFKKCIQSQNCDYPQDDPRSYELEIYKAMNQHLKNVDVLSSKMKEKILMSAAKVSDGYVKETVLKKLLADQIYSPDWRDIILDEYISQYNSRLIPEAIEYLKLNSSEADKIIINQRIAEAIATGSPMVANALAENLKIILDKNSVEFYKSYLSNLQEGPIKKNLARELNDFELHSSAG